MLEPGDLVFSSKLLIGTRMDVPDHKKRTFRIEPGEPLVIMCAVSWTPSPRVAGALDDIPSVEAWTSGGVVTLTGYQLYDIEKFVKH